jgi:hypothetical protein
MKRKDKLDVVVKDDWWARVPCRATGRGQPTLTDTGTDAERPAASRVIARWPRRGGSRFRGGKREHTFGLRKFSTRIGDRDGAAADLRGGKREHTLGRRKSSTRTGGRPPPQLGSAETAPQNVNPCRQLHRSLLDGRDRAATDYGGCKREHTLGRRKSFTRNGGPHLVSAPDSVLERVK